MEVEGESGFYQMYLGGLCNRRSWPKPRYSPYQPNPGHWACVVRVNNREYSTDVTYARKDLAQESAATRAYMICRNFSVNDGMYPGQRLEAGAQGMPVAIGAGRKGGGRAARSEENGGSGGGGGGGGGSCAAGGDGRSKGQSSRCSEDGEIVSGASGGGASSSGGGKRDRYGSYSGSSNGSEGESPRSVDSAVGFGQKNAPLCRCRRGLCTLKHDRCWMCLKDSGWTP